MFSVNNFYDYLRHKYPAQEKNIVIRNLYTNGSRNFLDLQPGVLPEGVPAKFDGFCELFDQEPVDLDQMYFDYDPHCGYDLLGPEYKECYKTYKEFDKLTFLCRHSSAVFTPIVCHSEKNSKDIELLTDHFYHEVHYWYHGLISRDWFRHWRRYDQPSLAYGKRFGLYARDASGTREYRIQLLKDLSNINEQVHFEFQPVIKTQIQSDEQLLNAWPDSNIEYDSNASAFIEWTDTKNFDIQIVAETLFDTSKTHLTEKVFKPIVMRQPFVLFGPPNSLSYLQNYGFKTFNSLWDESYDRETNPVARYHKALDVVKSLAQLTEEEFAKLLIRAQEIVDYNHALFFSDKFERALLCELQANLDHAIEARNEQFFTMPGGTWFYYLDLLNKKGANIGSWNKNRMGAILEYMAPIYPSVTKQILRRYSHLL